MKFCVNCGDKLEDDVNFCTSCGHKQPNLREMTPQVSLLQSSKQVEATKIKKNYNREKITDIIGGIIIVVGFIVWIILYVFFEEWVAFLWPYIMSIIIIVCILRFLGAGIVELFQRLKDKK